MKLAVLIVALCTASSTAITLAAERPKPQLQRANKALVLRGGRLTCGSKTPTSPSPELFHLVCLLTASEHPMVCLWCSFGAPCTRCGALGWLNLLPGSGGKIQNAFKKIYRREETVRQDKKIGRWDQAGGGPAEWIKGCKFRVLVVRGSVGFRPGP